MYKRTRIISISIDKRTPIWWTTLLIVYPTFSLPKRILMAPTREHQWCTSIEHILWKALIPPSPCRGAGVCCATRWVHSSSCGGRGWGRAWTHSWTRGEGGRQKVGTNHTVTTTYSFFYIHFPLFIRNIHFFISTSIHPYFRWIILLNLYQICFATVLFTFCRHAVNRDICVFWAHCVHLSAAAVGVVVRTAVLPLFMETYGLDDDDVVLCWTPPRRTQKAPGMPIMTSEKKGCVVKKKKKRRPSWIKRHR